MSDLIIGNLCSLLAMTANFISSTRKTAKGVLSMQAVSQLIYCVASIILKGYSVAVQNAVSAVRDLAATRKSLHKDTEWFLIILGVGLGILFDHRGLLGWLPIVANLGYSLAVFRFKDNERALKRLSL